MRIHLLRAAALAAALAACGDAPPPGEDLTTAPIPDSLRTELIALGRADQEPRQGLTPDRLRDTTFVRQLIRDDSARADRLRDIVARWGWPDTVRAGPAAANAAFLILQHSPDHAEQKRWVGALERLAQEGRMPRRDVALLVDRVLRNDSLPQRYGTQFDMVDGRFVMAPVEDEAGLEQRRRTMELPPMSEYLKSMEQAYGTPAVMHATDSASTTGT